MLTVEIPKIFTLSQVVKIQSNGSHVFFHTTTGVFQMEVEKLKNIGFSVAFLDTGEESSGKI